MIDAGGVGGIEMILALLSSLPVRDDWLQPILLGTRISCLEESQWVSELLFQNESVAKCFCENKSLVPLL